MMNMKKVIIIVFLIFAVLAAKTGAGSWPCYMGNNQRTGFTYQQAGGTLELKWSYNTYSGFVGSPVIKDNVLYIANRTGVIYAFDAYSDNPDVLWNYSNGNDIISSPCTDGNNIYVFSYDGQAYCLDCQDGSVKWSREIGGQNLSSPLVTDNYIYVGRGNPYKDVICMDKKTGSILKNAQTSQPIWSSPGLYDENIYVGSNDGSVYKFDKELNKLWRYDTETGIFRLSSIAIDEGCLYAAPGASVRRIISLDEHGAFRWESRELNTGGSGVFTSSVGADDKRAYVVMASTVQVLYCVDKQNGNLNWSVLLGDCSGTESYVSDPAVTYDTIFCGSEEGYLTSVSTAGAVNEKFIVEESSSSIVSSVGVSNGYIYTATKSGKVFVYRSSNIACVLSPDNGDTVSQSTVTITGSAVSPTFQNYSLYYGTGTNPSTWYLINNGNSQVDTSILGSWNIQSLPDGTYTIKLEVNSASSKGEARNTVTVDNPPQPPSSVSVQSTPFGSIKINWDKSFDDGSGDNDVDGYKIFRRKTDNEFNFSNPITDIEQGNKSYTDENIDTGIKYFYVLRSYDTGGNVSENSVEVSTVAYKNTVHVEADTGGSVELSDGTGVYFEPGCLKQDSEVAIAILDDDRIPQGEADSSSGDWVPTDKAWEFEIEPDKEFNKFATIKLHYQDSDIAGMNEKYLRVYWYDSNKSAWRMVDTSVPYPNLNEVHADVPHFSIYRIARYVSPEYVISKDSVYAYPNPAKGDEVYFKFKLMREAQVDIKVFNVAGELIEEFSEIYDKEEEGMTQEIKWGIDEIASGVYIWRIKAESSGREDEVIKKMAIVK